MNNLKHFSIGLIALSSALTYGQAQTNSEIFTNAAPKTYLDLLKQTFVTYPKSNEIDELWMKELTNQELFAEMQADVTSADSDEVVSYELSTELLKERLARLDEKTLFNVVYSPTLENVIKSFLKNRSQSFERLMALSEYYFPMFEEHLEKYDLPLEIKYLAIVESALNPHAKSYVGATGLWQFMYATGKQYKLEVNSYVDERYDPLKATDAACQYFSNMYKIFGDWDLVLASYNTGPGNVTKAMRRSGGKKNYWNLRPYLHKETQGYLPAFYATMYIYEYHKEHGITPKKAPVSFFETDTIMVKQKINFDQISELLDVPVAHIKFLNPIYKAEVIPYMSGKPYYLRLPKDKLAVFHANEEKIYAYVDYIQDKGEKPFENSRLASNGNYEVITQYKYHRVRAGESLSTIASKHKVSIANLRRWNNIKGNLIRSGQNLKIQTTTRVASAQKSAKVNSKKALKENTSELSSSLAANYANFKKRIHTIIAGETLDIIAATYKVSVSDILKWNKISGTKIISGKTLVIYQPVAASEKVKAEPLVVAPAKMIKKENSLFAQDQSLELNYVVRSGDTLQEIAHKTGLSIAELKKVNKLKSERLNPGQVLKI